MWAHFRVYISCYLVLLLLETPLWTAVQQQLCSNGAEHKASTHTFVPAIVLGACHSLFVADEGSLYCSGFLVLYTPLVFVQEPFLSHPLICNNTPVPSCLLSLITQWSFLLEDVLF